MTTQFKVKFLAIICLVYVVLATGCKKEEYVKTDPGKPEKRIQDFFGNGTSGTVRPEVIKLDKDTVYILDQDISIENGEQLIIEEGTLIKAGIWNVANPAANNPQQGSLTIRKGGSIIANGTSAEPIVFTSNALAGTQGVNWGGISIEGKSTDNDLLPGTADLTDFSGSLRFCRIEFAPLSLRGVGSRTLIENVMVSYVDRNGMSAFNIFGGSFNAYRLISYGSNGPADFYIANGYSGRMQYVWAYRHPYFGSTGFTPVNSLAGIFIENNANNPTDARPYTSPVISNVTILGPSEQNGLTPAYRDTTIRAAAIVTSNNSYFAIRNSAFLGCLQTCWIIDEAMTAEGLFNGQSTLSYSYFHAVDTAKPFSLKPGTAGQFDYNDLKTFVLDPARHNQFSFDLTQFSFRDVYAYNSTVPLPSAGSILQQGADFSDVFSDASVFNQVSFVGAFGTDDWTKSWVNFQPLKTNYNFPR